MLRSPEASPWFSCRRISQNLIEAYEHALGDGADGLDSIDYRWNITAAEIWELAREIHSRRPRGLIFVDHLPHPALLAEGLVQRFPEPGSLPRTIAHVYGDFTLYSKQWRRFGEVFRGSELTLVCASSRQSRLVSRYVENEAEVVLRCPFPVVSRNFEFSEAGRRSQRAAIGAGARESVLLYTGRLSLQKNVLRLVQEVALFARSRPEQRLHLVVAGDFDDIGAALFGVQPERGLYFQQWNALVASELVKGTPNLLIHAPGFQNSRELASWYSAADVFVSLSLHHDEDYGMSPAEAVIAGLPMVLTDWGGYADFRDYNPRCELVPVRILPEGLQIESESFQRALAQTLSSPLDGAQRKAAGGRASTMISTHAAGAVLRAALETGVEPFPGFKDGLSRIQETVQDPGKLGPPRAGGYYEEIYSAYVQ